MAESDTSENTLDQIGQLLHRSGMYTGDIKRSITDFEFTNVGAVDLELHRYIGKNFFDVTGYALDEGYLSVYTPENLLKIKSAIIAHPEFQSYLGNQLRNFDTLRYHEQLALGNFLKDVVGLDVVIDNGLVEGNFRLTDTSRASIVAGLGRAAGGSVQLASVPSVSTPAPVEKNPGVMASALGQDWGVATKIGAFFDSAGQKIQDSLNYSGVPSVTVELPPAQTSSVAPAVTQTQDKAFKVIVTDNGLALEGNRDEFYEALHRSETRDLVVADIKKALGEYLSADGKTISQAKYEALYKKIHEQSAPSLGPLTLAVQGDALLDDRLYSVGKDSLFYLRTEGQYGFVDTNGELIKEEPSAFQQLRSYFRAAAGALWSDEPVAPSTGLGAIPDETGSAPIFQPGNLPGQDQNPAARGQASTIMPPTAPVPPTPNDSVIVGQPDPQPHTRKVGEGYGFKLNSNAGIDLTGDPQLFLDDWSKQKDQVLEKMKTTILNILDSDKDKKISKDVLQNMQKALQDQLGKNTNNVSNELANAGLLALRAIERDQAYTITAPAQAVVTAPPVAPPAQSPAAPSAPPASSGAAPGAGSVARTPARSIDPQVEIIQRTLTLMGHNVGGIDGVIGPKTKAGIEAFMREHGVANAVDSRMANDVLEMMEHVINNMNSDQLAALAGKVSTAISSSKPDDVKNGQAALAAAGLYKSPLTGVRDKNTGDAYVALLDKQDARHTQELARKAPAQPTPSAGGGQKVATDNEKLGKEINPKDHEDLLEDMTEALKRATAEGADASKGIITIFDTSMIGGRGGMAVVLKTDAKGEIHIYEAKGSDLTGKALDPKLQKQVKKEVTDLYNGGKEEVPSNKPYTHSVEGVDIQVTLRRGEGWADEYKFDFHSIDGVSLAGPAAAGAGPQAAPKP